MSRFNVLKLKSGSNTADVNAPPPPPKDLYTKMFFSRSATSLAPSLSPDSISGPATPPSPYPPMGFEFGKRPLVTAAPSPVHSSGSLKSFGRTTRDYLPSPSVDGTDSSGSCPNVSPSPNLGVYLSNSASSSAYTLSQETTSSIRSKKSLFKLANLARRNKSKKDLSETGSPSTSATTTASIGGTSAKTDGDEGITRPWNFQHHIHVDEGYIGLPPSWSAALSQVGFSDDEIATIHTRRRVAAKLAIPHSPHATGGHAPPNTMDGAPTNASISAPSSTTLLEPVPRSTSLGKGRGTLTIKPPSTSFVSSSTFGSASSAPSLRTPPFSVKSFVTGLKNSLTSDSAGTEEDTGDSRGPESATGGEADQYVFVDGDGPDESNVEGMGDETLIDPYPFDSSSTISHHAHTSRIRQISQDQQTPRTPSFPQIQVVRANSDSQLDSTPSPAPRVASPLSCSPTLPLPAPPRGHTSKISPSPSRPGPLSAPPRTPPRRIYHIANTSSDGEDYSEPPPAYDSPKKGEWTPKKEKESPVPSGVLPPPNRPIPPVPDAQTLGEPSGVGNHNNAREDPEVSLTETCGHTVGSSVDIPGTADEVLDISSYYIDNSVHGEDAEIGPRQRVSEISPTAPLVIDKRLTKLTMLPPRLSFHQEGSLEDWSQSLFSAIGNKGKRSSGVVKFRSGDGTSVDERRTTIRPRPGKASAPSIPSSSLSSETVAPSLPDVSFGMNLTLGSIARPTADAIEDLEKQEQVEEDKVEETQDISGHDGGEQAVGNDATITEQEIDKVDEPPSIPPTLELCPTLNVPPPGKDLEPPVTTPLSAMESPQTNNIENLPPTPPPKPSKPAPLILPAATSLMPPRMNVITGVSRRSPVNSLFGPKPLPLPIPISPSQIRAQLRPAPPKPLHPPPTLPLPPLKRISSQPNLLPLPQSQLPPVPSLPKRHSPALQALSSGSCPSSPRTLHSVCVNQADRDSGLSTMTVMPATISTAKTEVVRTAVASVVDSDTVSLASQRESVISTADPEPQSVTNNGPDTIEESPLIPEHAEAPDNSIISKTSSVSLLRGGPQSKWPAPPPPPIELEAGSTPRRLSRFRTTSLGRVTQLQAMGSTITTPIATQFPRRSSETASGSTGESTPLMPNGVNGMSHPGLQGSLAPEARLLDSRTGTFGGVDIKVESEEVRSKPTTDTPLSESSTSSAMHPLLERLCPFITPRDPVSCFTNLVEIAEGESGSVFAARVLPAFAESLQEQQTGVERPVPPDASHVAVKRIPLPHPSSSPSLSDDSPISNKLVSVLHELSLLKNLDHEHLLLLDGAYVGPNSIPAEGAESAVAVDTSLWIRMELMERSLADVIGLVAEGLTLQDRLIGRFTSDILHGLDYLQRHHIAHRDVRSDNLLVNATGIVKLTDFSNAIRVDRNAPMVKGAVGVIYWQAPEMRAGPYNALKVDIWSLGATVWELAESVPPFSMPASPTAQASFAVQSAQHVGSQWPPLTHPEHYSRAFHEFLRLCGRESASRPSPGELLNTPFIRNACGRAVILQLLSQCRALEEVMMAQEVSTGRS